MKCYFDRPNNRLVYTGKTANDTHWDQHWKSEDLKFEKQIKIKNNRFVVGHTKRYVPCGSKILEAGCGRGNIVYALCRHGYKAYGVDYAKETVERINQCAPELKITVGDVRSLDFENAFFDGYWSLGVIEHFYDGYEDIICEMRRVLKPHGYLFITAPVMSPLRKFKAELELYPRWNYHDQFNSSFYQFAFNPKDVTANLERNGFKLIKTEPYDGVKGLKDEVLMLRHCLQYIYDSQSFFPKLLKKTLDITLKHFTHHMRLFIMQKSS